MTPSPEEVRRQEDHGPVGPFSTWDRLYGTVLIYGALTILVLWFLTRLLDPAAWP